MTTYKETLNLTHRLATTEEKEEGLVDLHPELYEELIELYKDSIEEGTTVPYLEELKGLVNRNAFLTGKGYKKFKVSYVSEDKDLKLVISCLKELGATTVTFISLDD